MLKTIKKNVQLRLDELIKYAWENDIRNKSYRSDNGQFVKFKENGRFISAWGIGSDDLFTVEIEEEITEDTIFDYLIPIEKDGTVYRGYKNSIDGMLNSYSNIVQILANIDGKYRTIWECDDHGSN